MIMGKTFLLGPSSNVAKEVIEVDIYDAEGSVRHDIAEAVESIFRYIENCPYKGVYPVAPPQPWENIFCYRGHNEPGTHSQTGFHIDKR
jgi:hypothetical protein